MPKFVLPTTFAASAVVAKSQSKEEVGTSNIIYTCRKEPTDSKLTAEDC